MAVEQNVPYEAPVGAAARTPADAREGWVASLDLEFALLAPQPESPDSRTRLVRRTHMGPLVVQRPFYPEGDVCHVYLVHPPGGVVGGDRLELRALARAGSHALITTPAATKFYRSVGRVAHQRQRITIEAATVEWLPQETILFPDACAKIGTRIDLAQGARFIGWDVVCYGRPASGLGFANGRVAQDFELWLGDVPLILDHLRLNGAGESMHAPFGLASHAVLGTMFAYPADDAMVAAARSISAEGVQVACTRVDGAFVCRAVAAQADAVRRLFIEIWRRLRPAIAGREAVLPRIWAT